MIKITRSRWFWKEKHKYKTQYDLVKMLIWEQEWKLAKTTFIESVNLTNVIETKIKRSLQRIFDHNFYFSLQFWNKTHFDFVLRHKRMTYYSLRRRNIYYIWNSNFSYILSLDISSSKKKVFLKLNLNYNMSKFWSIHDEKYVKLIL